MSAIHASRRPYHHGNLKAVLLAEAERMLEADGIQSLTLRAVSRAAGVSHAAPANHFGDLGGLLSELAASGYQRFGSRLAAAMEAAGADSQDRLKAMGRAYVGFARTHPGLFALMFRSERLDATRPALTEAIAGARLALRDAITARSAAGSLTPLQAAADATAVWSLVHGFSMLLLEGRLANTIRSLPGEETADTLLEAVLSATKLRA